MKNRIDASIHPDKAEPPQGLWNAATMIAKYLRTRNVEVDVKATTDGNSIEKEIYGQRYTHIILEALWCPPEKILELSIIYPKIKWIVRAHSQLSFLANEGEAIRHIVDIENIQRKRNNVFFSSNAKELYDIFRVIRKNLRVVYLPNVYDIELFKERDFSKNSSIMHIGCFGALRPMKNQLFQAAVAIATAESFNKTLHFHINHNEDVNVHNSIHKSLNFLFKNTDHRLINHSWAEHDDFMKIIRKMDIGLQVSFTETFNIVAADFVNEGIPILVSHSIHWLDEYFKVETDEFNEAVDKLKLLYKDRNSINIQKKMYQSLLDFCNLSKNEWVTYLNI